MIGINPYWWTPSVSPAVSRINIGGIFKLSTNAVSLSTDTVDYGINPIIYRQLPIESLVLLSVHSDPPEDSDSLPVTIVVPSTTSTISEDNNTTKIKIVDSQGTEVTGANIKGGTQRLVYINKSTGVIRFMEFINQ